MSANIMNTIVVPCLNMKGGRSPKSSLTLFDLWFCWLFAFMFFGGGRMIFFTEDGKAPPLQALRLFGGRKGSATFRRLESLRYFTEAGCLRYFLYWPSSS